MSQPRPGDADRSADPVLVRRDRIAAVASAGQRVGYAAFGLAVAVFVVGFVAGFTSVHSRVVVWLLIGGSVVLAPAIVTAYAVKAAEREDRERGEGPRAG